MAEHVLRLGGGSPVSVVSLLRTVDEDKAEQETDCTEKDVGVLDVTSEVDLGAVKGTNACEKPRNAGREDRAWLEQH